MNSKPCTCEHCLELINKPESRSYWFNQFVKDLASGKVQHIGTSPDGRPIYRDL